MKLMINGAVTIGTLDGANVEIAEAVGPDNIYIFGLTTPEVDDLWRRGYRSSEYYNTNELLRKAVDYLKVGFNGVNFTEFYNYLLMGPGIADPYMCLADFDSYCKAHDQLLSDYANREEWAKKSLMNIASAGVFAADRSIRDYAENIWHIKPILEKNN
jgi:starch phosphorylase